jgi:hypothetical protein
MCRNLDHRIVRRDADAIRMKRFEFALAVLLTIALIVAHVMFFAHAGPLWRDEISSLTLATKAAPSEFWTSLKFDPFPAVYFLVLRGWHALFGGSDVALRALGLLIGLALVGSLWFASYQSGKSPPLWPLVLFAFNPLTLEGGDSLRPYGFGLIWIVLAFAFIARITFGAANKIVIACGFATAVLSVQSNFTNALILFAIICGSVVVLLKNCAWRRILVVLAFGAAAALSLLPYLPVMNATTDWSKILANENHFISVVAVARDAIGNSGVISEWIWIVLIIAIFVFAIFTVLSRSRITEHRERDRIIFGAIVLFSAFMMTVGFLCLAKYLVFPRYFLTVMAIGALCISLFFNAIPHRTIIRAVAVCLVLIVAIASLRPLLAYARMRMTNCDQIAAIVEQRAAADDLIILTSPLYGISFQRYYHGSASSVTLPPVADLTLHRWDLIKQAMAEPDPVPELMARVQNVMRAGHKIFLVGKLGPAPPTQPEPLPPAPQSPFGWNMEAYTAQWKSELTYWFEHHALHGTNVPVGQSEFINPVETLGLFEISGLREP